MYQKKINYIKIHCLIDQAKKVWVIITDEQNVIVILNHKIKTLKSSGICLVLITVQNLSMADKNITQIPHIASLRVVPHLPSYLELPGSGSFYLFRGFPKGKTNGPVTLRLYFCSLILGL